jgi:tetratricopeptide (TPR) repeat protein
MKNIFLSLLIIGFTTGFSQTKKDYTFAYATDSILSQGFAYYQKEQYNDAVTEFQKIAKSDPKYLVAQYEIALSLFSDNKKELLLSHLENLHKKEK